MSAVPSVPSTAELPLAPLGPLEARVMGVLWDVGPSTAREVIARLGSEHAYTTIATVTTHLEEKGLLARVREGRSVRFTPTLARHEYCARMMRGILDSGGNRAASIECFVDQLSPDDLAVLRGVLARHP